MSTKQLPYHGSIKQSLRLRIPQVVVYSLLHVSLLLIPFCFSWSGLIIFFVSFYVCGGLGITLCFHRLITHRSFRTFRPIEYFLVIIGCTNLLDGPIGWCGTHRQHHAEAEQSGDPHTTKVSFWWAHFDWFFFRPPLPPEDFCRDLTRDPIIAWIDRLSLLPPLAISAFLFGTGWFVGGAHLAISWLVYGVSLRTVLVFHSAGFVNSATHMWGYRNFDTPDNSRNLWWVAIISLGEGWHNNHHAQQRSAAHGMFTGEFDLTYQMIRGLAALGLVWDVVKPEVPRGTARPPADGQAISIDGAT